ncbi:hypothetical protein Tcan_16835 [Toxocara canis]|uniref:Uncharacterized protein n=1 Tax=Toxocara canis TaxID=6265 RepID=A0A0B2VFK2_TOXCA|nr:hypothetical protein Tcan_16835 [Toxocara canis]
MVGEKNEVRNGFSSLLKEKVIVQQIWAGININNSWERLLIEAPHSLAALEKLIMQSVKNSCSDPDYEPSKCRSKMSTRTGNRNRTVSSSSSQLNDTLSKMMAIELESLRSHTTVSFMTIAQSSATNLAEELLCKRSSSSLRISNSGLNVASNDPIQKDCGDTSSTTATVVSVGGNVVNAMTEARAALGSAHQAMASIGKKTNDIPRTIGAVLALIELLDLQCTPKKVRDELDRLHHIIEECAQEAFTLEDLFQEAIKLADIKSAKLGRTGFMLLGEVKHFWEKIVAFCDEISKLIEYTLDSSCNAFVAIILEQVEKASSSTKFHLKDRSRHEIYQVSLACVAYALSVRHLTDAYSAFSTEFLMPQMDAISRYPLVAHSEIELAHAHDQFKESNLACNKEIDRIVKTNRATCKRRSILELDFGLDLHLSDISADLDEFLTPIAQFKQRAANKKSNIVDEGKSSTVFERFRSSFSKKPSP